MKKAFAIVGFMVFGTALGFAAVWFRQHTDTVFLLNIPGTWLGDAVYDLSIRFFGDPCSSQAHYTIPWLLRIPQVYLPASIFFWGILGTLFAKFLKPKMIALMMGYILSYSGLSIYWLKLERRKKTCGSGWV